MTKKILFLHGLESKPGGSKVSFIESLGFEVLNPHLPKESWKESVLIAQLMNDKHKPDIIVGSSRGGAVALNIETDAKLVLIAPAWKKYGNVRKVDDAVILHSARDKIIPLYDTMSLARTGTGTRTIICGESHRMSDKYALEKLKLVLENM